MKDGQSQSTCPRIRLDYCTITDKSQEEASDDAAVDGDADAAKLDAAGYDDKPDDKDVEGQSITVLVMQEISNRSVWAYGVESKGASESWVIEQIVEDLDTVGLRNDKVVVKSDQEPSVQEVSRAIARARAADYGTAIEASSVGDSNSNASIERAIQDVEGQIRTLRSALEERVNAKIHIKAQVVDWMVRHAACLISRCRVRHDGWTAMQSIKCRQPISKIAEFGEVVHFKIPKTQAMPGKYEDRWSEGLWLGFEMRTAEHLVGTDVGVLRVNAVMGWPPLILAMHSTCESSTFHLSTRPRQGMRAQSRRP